MHLVAGTACAGADRGRRSAGGRSEEGERKLHSVRLERCGADDEGRAEGVRAVRDTSRAVPRAMRGSAEVKSRVQN